MTIGERIAEAAALKGINLHKLAKQSNISYNTLYSIVRRKSDRVDYDLLSDIADVLNVSFGYLIGEESIDAKEKNDRIRSAIIRGEFSEAEKILGLPPGSLITVDESEIADYEKSKKEKEYNLNRLKYCIGAKYSVFSEEDFLSLKELFYAFRLLNAEGQRKAIERIEELSEIPKYQKQYSLEEDQREEITLADCRDSQKSEDEEGNNA